MDAKKITVITSALSVIGIILILMMAFDIMPAKGNILLFLGIVCLIVAGAVKGLSKKLK